MLFKSIDGQSSPVLEACCHSILLRSLAGKGLDPHAYRARGGRALLSQVPEQEWLLSALSLPPQRMSDWSLIVCGFGGLA